MHFSPAKNVRRRGYGKDMAMFGLAYNTTVRHVMFKR
ncbi:hypothetical protein ABIA54_001277 [Pseudomonas sp. EB276 TE3739]